MRNSNVLRVALNTIQASGVDVRTLSDRTGMCYATCRKILLDKKGEQRYFWSTIEFALRHVGCELVVVTSAREERTTSSEGYTRRRASGRRS